MWIHLLPTLKTCNKNMAGFQQAVRLSRRKGQIVPSTQVFHCVSGVLLAAGGSVCHTLEQVTDLCVASSGPISLSCGYLVHPLAWSSCICLVLTVLFAQGLGEGEEGSQC